MDNETAPVLWHILTGAEFQAALDGERHPPDWTLRAKTWLAPPVANRLPYYRHGFPHSPDTRVFFIATTDPDPASERPDRRRAVAMIEIAQEHGSENTVGLKYVSVDVDFRERGLARQLYRMLISHLEEDGLRLYRTAPGRHTPERFTESITRLLEDSAVDWYTREMEEKKRRALWASM